MLFHSGIQRWLDEIVGGGGALPQAAPLDPFATSMRNCGRAAAWLGDVRDLAPISANDPTQAVTDMRSAGWVSGALPNVALTNLGDALLDEWTTLGVLNEDRRFEIVRAGTLIGRALDLGLDQYTQMFEFWEMLVAHQPADYWWENLHSMYLPSYLNAADSAGFNPLAAMLRVSGSLGTAAEWDELASDATFAGSQYLQKVLTRVNNYRPGGRRHFLQAMEAYRLARQAPESFNQVVTGWDIT